MTEINVVDIHCPVCGSGNVKSKVGDAETEWYLCLEDPLKVQHYVNDLPISNFGRDFWFSDDGRIDCYFLDPTVKLETLKRADFKDNQHLLKSPGNGEAMLHGGTYVALNPPDLATHKVAEWEAFVD